MKLKAELTLRRVGADSIIIMPGQGTADITKVCSLNDTAAWLWRRLGTTDFTEEEIAGLLMEQYGVDQAQAATDARNWVDTLKKQGLLEE
jgi:hypothetical protein